MQRKEDFMGEVQSRIDVFRRQRSEEKTQKQQEVLVKEQEADIQRRLKKDEEIQKRAIIQAELIDMGVVDVFKNLIDTQSLGYYDQVGIISKPIYGFFGKKVIGQEKVYKTSLDSSDMLPLEYGYGFKLRVASGYYMESGNPELLESWFVPRNSIIYVCKVFDHYNVGFLDDDRDMSVGTATSSESSPGVNLLERMYKFIGRKEVETREEVLDTLTDIIAAYKHNADLLINHQREPFEEADFMRFGEVSAYH